MILDKPHSKHFVKNNLPKDRIFFIDTSFVLATVLSDSSYKHTASEEFAKRLIKEKMNIVSSSILFSECWNGLIKNELKEAWGEGLNIPQIIKNEFYKLKPHLDEVEKNLNLVFDFLSKFHHYLTISPNKDIMQKAYELHKKYEIGINDSIHLGTMLYNNKKDIAMFDNEIRDKVEEINIWCKFPE